MNISHYPVDSNRAILVAIQGTNQSKYLESDYFLPSSCNESYYSRKFSSNNATNTISQHHAANTIAGNEPIYQVKSSKIYRVASTILLSLSFFATAVEVKAQPNTETSTLEQSTMFSNTSFLFGNGSEGTSTNAPIPPKMLQSLLASTSNSTTSPTLPPVPPSAPAMPDLASDANSSEGGSNNRSAFLESIRNFGKKALKKVKREPKPVVVSSSYQDLVSQLHNTLERRRKGIAGEEKNNKLKQAAKQVIVLTAEEQKARDTEIAKKIAENKEKAATIRKQKSQEWEANRKKILAEVEIENQRRAAEAAKAIREQKAKENGSDSNAVIAGIDPVLHNNIVADLRQEISNLKEQLTLNGNVISEGINDLGSNGNARSKRSLEGNRIVETKDQSTSTEDLIVLEDRLFNEKLKNWEFEEDEAVKKLDEVISRYSDNDSGYDDEALEDNTDSDNSLDTNDVVSKIVSQSNSIVSETVQDELADVEQELQSQKLKEEESVEAVEDILSADLMTDTVEQAGINISPASPQEELARRANIIAKASDDLRFGSKAISKQIRHRLLTRDIGSLVAVSAGDEEQDIAPSYSIWSSGIFGGSKQKDTSHIIGHSSKIHGGTIGGEINLSSDLMFGVSYSRLSSKIKYPSMLDAGSNVSRTNTNIFSIYNGTTLAENTNLQTLASVALSGKNGNKQDIVKPKSKLFSFESHLNQKITFQNNITLIPSIGFRYEYGRVGVIRDSYALHHKKSKSSTFSGEVGARVLFTPIKISSDFKLVPTAHISLDKRIRGSKHNGWQLISIKDIGGEASVVSSNSNHAKLSTNIGGGLIASHKNISLECLYDMQKQRSFKSHQGVLKFKVNL